jgi:hypothetical protein
LAGVVKGAWGIFLDFCRGVGRAACPRGGAGWREVRCGGGPGRGRGKRAKGFEASTYGLEGTRENTLKTSVFCFCGSGVRRSVVFRPLASHQSFSQLIVLVGPRGEVAIGPGDVVVGQGQGPFRCGFRAVGHAVRVRASGVYRRAAAATLLGDLLCRCAPASRPRKFPARMGKPTDARRRSARRA